MIERPAIIKSALALASRLTDDGKITCASRLHDMANIYQNSPTADNYDLLHNLMAKYGA